MKHSTFPTLFLGTDHLSLQCLNRLIEHPEIEIKGVVTQVIRPKGRGMRFLLSPIAQRGNELSLPVFTPHDLRSSEFLYQIKQLKVEWVILLSYGRILPPCFLSLFPEKAMNFHASLLPRWRGAAPIQRAIMAGDQELGMSLQVMENRLDTGPLIGSRSFKMGKEMDATEVFKKMEFLIQELLVDLLEYMKGKRTSIPQNGTPTYAHKLSKKESRIVWNNTALQISNKIKALVIGPQAYTTYKGKRIKIYKAKCISEEVNITPGQIISINSDSFQVACRDSVLSIMSLQPESKKKMSAAEYIRGYHLKAGDTLN